MASNTDVVVGWFGLGAAMVLGYSAYKNKPAFGAGGIVNTAIQSGKISSTPVPNSGGAVQPSMPSEAPVRPAPAPTAPSFSMPALPGFSSLPGASAVQGVLGLPQQLGNAVGGWLGKLLGF